MRSGCSFFEVYMKRLINYFTRLELAIWLCSIALILASFLIFDRSGYLSMISSLVGVTSLILCAKGNPAGQVLMILFSLLYGVISLGFRYYGEMITYLVMCAPMAAFSLYTWIKNPFDKETREVKVNDIGRRDIILMLLLTAVVTVAFYFILGALGNENLLVSTLSVATSFAAAYLTMKRSPYFALAYGFNDLVLIVLWSLAAFEDISYLSVVICFLVFLVNDTYGFISWIKMRRSQRESIARSKISNGAENTLQ